MSSFGSTEVFSIRLTPLMGGPQEEDPSAAATWVGMELWVNGVNLLKHSHDSTGTVHDQVNWPAIYLTRWLVRKWRGFFCDQRWPLPGHWRNALEVGEVLDRHLLDSEEVGDEPRVEDLLSTRDLFMSSHCVTSGAGGSLFPEVYFARDGERVSVAWRTSLTSNGAWFRQNDGETDIPATAFLDVATQFVRWCHGQIQHLQHPIPQADTREMALWLDYVSTLEAAEDSLFGYMGIDRSGPRREDVGRALRLPAAWGSVAAAFDPSTVGAAVVFRALAPVLGVDDILGLLERLEEVQPRPEVGRRLDEVGRSLPSWRRDVADFEQGYMVAQHLRERLGNSERYLDIHGLLTGWNVQVEEIRLADPMIDGGAIWTDDRGPLVFLNPESEKTKTPWGRRMVLAHELCHLLQDRGRSRALRIVSTPWAPPLMERRANAFAAELLLPKRGMIKEMGIPQAFPDERSLRRLMSKFRVGRTTCERHISNRFRF